MNEKKKEKESKLGQNVLNSDVVCGHFFFISSSPVLANLTDVHTYC